MLQPNTLIIFDIDGTLTDTKAVDDYCFIEAFKSVFNIDLEGIDWASLTNVTDRGITEEVIKRKTDKALTSEAYQLLEKELIKRLERELAINPNKFNAVNGAVDFYNLVKKDKNFAIGIGTGACEKSALIKLGANDIDVKNIPFSNSNHSVTREGITERTIKEASKQLNANFKNIVYFGDGLWDYKTCNNLNIHFIGIDILNDGKLKAAGAKHVFPNFKNTEAILNCINELTVN